MGSKQIQMLNSQFIALHKTTGNLNYADHLPTISNDFRDDRRRRRRRHMIFLESKTTTWGSSRGLYKPSMPSRSSFKVKSADSAGPPLPSDNSSGSWKAWIIGMIITIILPFWTKNKWGPLLNLKQKVEIALDGAEEVAEVVEKVAEEMEKVADEVADHVHQGKLHDAAEVVEKIAKETAMGAQKLEQTLEKVEEIEKELTKDVEEDVGLLSELISQQQKIDGDAK